MTFYAKLILIMIVMWLGLHAAYIPFLAGVDLEAYWKNTNSSFILSKICLVLSLASTMILLISWPIGVVVSALFFFIHSILVLKK